MKEIADRSNRKESQIAVIGIGCYYPGAKSPLQLWENILARRQQFREMPDLRLPQIDYYDPDPSVAGKTYQNKAAVLDGYHFNWLDKKIPKATYESTDIVHWLALDTALQALADARYSKETLPNDTTGVIFGNTLTGELTRSNQMFLRWPYIKRVLTASLKKKGLLHYMDSLEETMEKYYKSVFTPTNEDSLAGGLANTIAGRVCNFLDLHGGGYIVDGACSSSLLAIATAANYLESGQMDMVIAGGVDISLDTFEIVGFSKTKALTPDEMRVYDKQGRGFLPGEGCGAVVLKRLEDAIRDKDQVYAIIKGWGISSDGKGGITAPSAKGQSMALLRAHKKANIDPEQLNFIEGHGTGTTVGDRVELEGITIALNQDKQLPRRNCGVTSFKSIVGHTKAAAGVGAFIKTVIALNQRILPPTAGLKEFNPIFEDTAKILYPIMFGEIKDPKSKLLAGVSAMGFGGINSHVVLQSGDAPSLNFKTSLDIKRLLVSNQTSELFLFTATSKEQLIDILNIAADEIKGASYAELADYAHSHNSKIDIKNTFRAGLVALNPFDLERKLLLLKNQLLENPDKNFLSLEKDTIVYGKKIENLRIGALFPGQGAQRLNMTYKLVERFDWAENTAKQANQIFLLENRVDILNKIFKRTDKANDANEEIEWKDDLKQTNIAQPAITLASLLWFQYLSKLGIKLSAASGHSLGELMSFYVAGAFDEETLLKFAAFRGKTMADCGSGTMASLVCTRELAEEYIKAAPGYVSIANINAPEQTVISGEKESVKFIIKLAEKDNIGAVELPVSAAFHSKLIADTAKSIQAYKPLQKTPSALNLKLISSVTGKEVAETTDLNSYFADQSVKQVNFIDTVNTLKDECDVLIEIGSGRVLSGLVNHIRKDILCFPTEAVANDDISMNTMLANVFVHGADIIIEELYKNRLIRDYTPAYEKEFIVNPLEKPFPEALLKSVDEKQQPLNLNFIEEEFGFNDIRFKEYLDERGEFLKDMIQADMNHFRKNGNRKHIGVSTVLAEDIAKQDSVKVNELPEPEEQDVKYVLHEKIASATGFPVDSFKDEMKLLEDFNLDSIKAGSLLLDLSKTFNLKGKISTAQLANASIGTIVSEFNSILPPPAISMNKSGVSKDEIVQSVKELAAEKTGFPETQITPELKLLNDLNLDSIKAGDFIAALLKKYNIQGKVEASAYANASLADIIDKICELVLPADNTISQPENNIEETVIALASEKTGFPVNGIKRESKLLDDLNLDSIKAGGFIAELTKKYNIQGKLEAAKFTNAKLEDIIVEINNCLGLDIKPAIEKQEKAEDIDKVSAFTVCLVDTPLIIDKQKNSEYWKDKNLAIVYSPGSKNQALALNEAFKNNVKSTIVYSSNELNSIEKNVAPDFILTIIPEGPATINNVNEVSGLLSDVAGFDNNLNTELGFVQFGDGSFAKKNLNKLKQINAFSVVGFVSSIHLERPNQKLRVTEFDKSISNQQLSAFIRDEFISHDPFIVAGYDKNLVRRTMVYDLAENESRPRKSPVLSKNDVVLVTGGAKGITAACGLQLADTYHCKMALVGSSNPSDEVMETLKHYTEKNLMAKYYSCDVSNPESVKTLIKKVHSELGTITSVIHGAGKNIPRRAEQVTTNMALDEIAPKLIGAINIIDALDKKSLKSFIAFTSIIGVTGMQGNSWYAFSNETLDLILRNIQIQYGIETLALGYSVWSEVGMGARMGSAETLAHMGIGAISPGPGIEQFLHWIKNKAGDQQVVIAASLGGLDTWKRKTFIKPPANRYLENVIHFEPETELIVRSTLSRETDLYTDDHNYNGSLLFPTVFGIEAMAQAVAMVAGLTRLNSLKLENISLLKPIVVPDSGTTEIQIHAIVQEKNKDGRIKITAGISTEQSDFTEDHFSADFILGIKSPMVTKEIRMTDKPLQINPEIDLYGWLLFQGKTFQLIDQVYSLNSEEVLFKTKKIHTDTSELCFSEHVLAPFLLNSPLLRDNMLQSPQLVLTQKRYLPIRIKEWEFFNVSNQSDGEIIACRIVENNSESGTCDVLFLNKEKEIIEHIQGYEFKAMEPTPDFPLPEKLADLPSLFRNKITSAFKENDSDILEKPMLTVYKHAEEFNMLNQQVRRELAQKLFKEEFLNQEIFGLKTGENKISWSQNGKPKIQNSDLNISISHSKTVLILTVGNSMQGCDIEFVENRSKNDWAALLDFKYQGTFDQLAETDTNYNISGTRLWCVKEAVIKAFGYIPSNITIEKIYGNHIVFAVKVPDETIYVDTFSTQVLPNNIYVSATTVNINSSENQSEIRGNKPSANDNLFEKEDGKFVTRFFTTFKDCKGFFGKTYFTNYPTWMGSMRELVLSPIAKPLLKDLGSGKFGMVTNASSIKIYNEAEALNKITGKLWVTKKTDLDNSFIDLNFSWYKQSEIGKLIKLANCNLSTTWVRIEDRGIVKKCPLPAYFNDFLSENIINENVEEKQDFPAKYLSVNDLGKLTYKSSSAPKPEILLSNKVFQTGIYDSNSVGNLYYSNYYDWQAKNIETIIYQIYPDLFLNNGKSGEFICLEANINHLQEAMPFEEIEVCMYLEELYSNGLKLFFEYFSLDKNSKRKLAYGSNTLIWAKRLHNNSLPYVKPIPDSITKQLQLKITTV
ncbi:MAG: SDR family NAD(P)-dependent oxidoreductase [Bacteroidales bacterium]|nr:SDR family NAD(P)-dependent oxidoreductase [Bacteroidales bacterium]